MTNKDAFAPQPLVKFRPLKHHIRVYRFIVRLVTDTGRAEDLVSEVFIDVWGQAGRFEGRSLVSTWILSARFKALSALHRRRDAQLDETSTEMLADTGIARMSQEHREVIDLVYYHETVEEVAEIIQMPKNTVKTRTFYARKRLAQLLSIHQDFKHLIVARAA